METQGTGTPASVEAVKKKAPIMGILSWAMLLLAGSVIFLESRLGFIFYDLCLGETFFFILGIIFGIIGLVQKNRKKSFAISGIVLNLLSMLGYLFLLAVMNIGYYPVLIQFK